MIAAEAGDATMRAGRPVRESSARPDGPSGKEFRLHPLVWACWFAVALSVVFLTSNPLYAALVGLAALCQYAAHRPDDRRLDYVLVIGALFAFATIPLNLISGSSGTTQLVSLPTLTVPHWLGGVRFGGPITAESLAYAASQAVRLSAVFIVVWAFNVSVDHFRLLKYAPAGLAQLGVILSVGLLLVPSAIDSLAMMQEARTTRGQGGARWAALPALAIPLLRESLERSVQRAESLDARGFGRLAFVQRPYESLIAVAALVAAAGGAFAYYYAPMPAVAVLVALGGMATLLAIVARQWRGSSTVRLRPDRFGSGDLFVVGACLASLGIIAALRLTGAGSLVFLPFPRASAPGFDPLAGLACVLLAAPLVPELLRRSP
ncbi:MAG: energy-coupling factor transporter transmembrane component T family protein [Dehalococcoidia bacterium]